ncbi:MAG: acetoacetate--CoA ligase [Gammaproteobacteria bacterium]|nr:acetoacetate--CoA ligase [Gammaproteobacteria bacterium]
MTTATTPPALAEGDLLWQPTAARIDKARITDFMRWLARERGVACPDYDSLYRWSVECLEDFWAAVWDYFEIRSSAPYKQVLDRRVMPGAKWFEGARLNFAEHVLRHAAGKAEALYFAAEGRPVSALSGDALLAEVARVAAGLRARGIGPGDRVVAFMPNIPETMIACLAATAIGAVWSSTSSDFGAASVLDRFQQIEPKALFTVDGYRYGGKDFDRRDEARRIIEALPTLEQVFFLPYLDASAAPPVTNAITWGDIHAGDEVPPLAYEQVDFDHPLWVVYSSGTTGLPKAIVHGHGGIVVEIHKGLALQSNLGPDSRMFFYTTSGWIMWNILMCSMMVGAAPVIYDGHPAAPNVDVLWQLAATTRATQFGASPTYLAMMQKDGIVPRERYDVSAIEGVLLTGSPATPESMKWLYDNVNEDLWVTSQSGGTDVASGFVSGSCILPVYAGEIQARALAVDVQAYDDAGEPVVGEVGELVVTQPMPSMPLYFWNDAGGRRYHESYFDTFPGVWRHGDFFQLNRRGGCFIKGRSDSTLNRYGVRIGTAEIYRCVEALPEIDDSLVVNLDLPGGRFFMPMFVRLAAGAALDETLVKKLAAALREQCSPRHVPDKVYAVEAIPYTLTGKKLEVPVRKILMGFDLAKAVSRDAMQNPDSIEYFIRFAAEQADYSLS